MTRKSQGQSQQTLSLSYEDSFPGTSCTRDCLHQMGAVFYVSYWLLATTYIEKIIVLSYLDCFTASSKLRASPGAKLVGVAEMFAYVTESAENHRGWEDLVRVAKCANCELADVSCISLSTATAYFPGLLLPS